MNPNISPLCPVCGQPLRRGTFGLFDGYGKTVPSPIYYCINGDCVEGEARAKVKKELFQGDTVAHNDKIIKKLIKEEAGRRAAALERLIDANLRTME